MKKVVSVILILISAVLFVSCKRETEKPVYTVRFDVSYCSVTVDAPTDASVREGESVVLPTLYAEPPVGKVFVWTLDPVGKAIYDGSKAVTTDLTLYAVEVPKQYKITYLFEIDGVVNSVKNPSAYDVTKELTLNPPASLPFGYKFMKWCYADDPDSNVTTIAKGTQGDIVLRAYIRRARYSVLVTNRKGIADPNEAEYVYGEEITLKPLAAEGFIRYVAEKDPSLVVTTLTPEFVAENYEALLHGGNISLRAVWSEEE